MNENNVTTERIKLFESVFQGRKDVFAIRWEKGNKSGYMPAYQYDPYRYKVHRMKGGTFNNFTEKSYISLSNHQIEKHLNGNQLIGIYPLLHDNTSWFIAADFDKNNWQEESKSFLSICHQFKLPAYVERSRSGNGGHVWIFFNQAYPAFKSRKVMISLLERCGSFSIFDKTSSFDRLFPNQDTLSGKGLGNLIALPLHQPSWQRGNSCFINPETFEPYSNQWEFLHQIKRVGTAQLDELFDSLSHAVTSITENTPSSLTVTLNESLTLNRNAITLQLTNFLKSEFNIPNSEYFIKRKANKNTWNTNKYFKLIEKTETAIVLPKGSVGKVIRFCREQKIDFDFKDERTKLPTIPFTIDSKLRKHQLIALEASRKKDFGIIVAPPGSGKTVMGLHIIVEKQQPALIIVHRKQLMEQWIERIEAFLKIQKKDIGKIGQGKTKIGKQITVATIQSLNKKTHDNELFKSFKTVIIDECHHIPAESFHTTIGNLNTYYQYGLTATPFRKHGGQKLICAYLGEIIAKIKPQEIETYKRARIIVRNTELNIPFHSKNDPFEHLSNVLIHDSARNELIVDDISKEVSLGKKAVVITERIAHIETLMLFLKQSFEVITLSGDDAEKDRKSKWELLKKGDYEVLITTGQFFGEGTDLSNLNCLFLVYPFSFKGKLIQYIGRVQRSEITPIIYDYCDHKIEYLNRLFLKRNVHYRHLDKQATLFDDPDETASLTPGEVVSINKTISISIDQLDFRFGSMAFKYSESSIKEELEFEIENEYIRPEFDVLKPYFAKAFGSKSFKIDIHAEIEHGILVSQSATSADLEKINRAIIESVRFKFVENQYFGNKSKGAINALTHEEPDQTSSPLYESNEDLLDDILYNKKVKHFRQLRYLADHHQRKVLKLRFVLSPFSFVFLLSGEHQYHIILETLDTEEATYIWHTRLSVEQVEKDVHFLRNHLKLVDEDLNTIKNKGRQVFLENEPKNFSRVLHDYSDERKGFILWRDALEQVIY